ncbi:MAG: queuosine precursor transporter [bacterium]|nr:queuosine precursor transporter [bacterium]
MPPLSEKDHKKILICLAIYLSSLFASNTLGLKIMPFLFGSHLSVAVFFFPVVFLMTDVIGEVYGKRLAKLFVRAGFISTAMFLVYSVLSLSLPWAEKGMWAQEGYNLIFGVSGRIALASLVAFIVAEYQDVLTFFFVRAKIGPRLFWLRSLLSNIWSQLLDSSLFMVVAFAGIYETKTLIGIIITWWLYKVLMGFLYTPLSYLGIYLLRGKKSQHGQQEVQN